MLMITMINFAGQTPIVDDENFLRWCTISKEEQYKCLNFSIAVKRDVEAGRFGRDAIRLDCKQVRTH